MSVYMVAVDGSDHAEKALDVAGSLARSDQATLHVVHVVSDGEPVPGIREDIEVEFRHELQQRIAASTPLYDNLSEIPEAGDMITQHAEVSRAINTLYGEQILQRAKDQLHSSGHESVTTQLLNGHPADKLVAHARQCGADTVILGCRGLGRVRLMLGSVSQQVTHDLECRVILVK